MKPPLLVVLFFIFASTGVTYGTYQFWFEPKKILKRYRKMIYNQPNWIPFKGLNMAWVNGDKGWITFNRIMSIFAEVFVIGMTTFLIIGWFIGN
jgi:hypothetical protein